MRSINEFLKSQPAVILVLALLLIIALTPAVFLFAQQQSEREIRAREQYAYSRLEEADKRTFEITNRIGTVEDQFRSFRSDVAQTKTNLDIAVKSVVELQKQVADLQKQVADLQKQKVDSPKQ